MEEIKENEFKNKIKENNGIKIGIQRLIAMRKH